MAAFARALAGVRLLLAVAIVLAIEALASVITRTLPPAASERDAFLGVVYLLAISCSALVVPFLAAATGLGGNLAATGLLRRTTFREAWPPALVTAVLVGLSVGTSWGGSVVTAPDPRPVL
jgi:hypothetical protein